jgi:hypothetical protein
VNLHTLTPSSRAHRSLARPADHAAQADAAAHLEQAWGCTVHPFAYYDSVDWAPQRRRRTFGVAEFKARAHEHDRYPTVWFNAHKWIELSMWSSGMGVEPYYIVRFTVCIRWIDAGDIDARDHQMNGGQPRVGAPNDRELIVNIPIIQLHPLDQPPKETLF